MMRSPKDEKILIGVHQAKSIASELVGLSTSTTPISVNLISCYGANGGTFSNAQALANQLKIKVIGYLGKVKPIEARSKCIPHRTRTFEPQGPREAYFSGVGHNIFGQIAKTTLSLYRIVKPPVDNVDANHIRM
ncbi:hypothetical protein [Yersinia nurmii]|nr:hypothetical protein [Yersinia nurmii]